MAHRDTSVSALCRELGINPVTLDRYVGRSASCASKARRSSVQRQLLLPLGVNYFCRFRSSWIEINNSDACGTYGRRLRRPYVPQAARLPDHPGVHVFEGRRARGSSGPGARPRGAGAGGDVRRDRSMR